MALTGLRKKRFGKQADLEAGSSSPVDFKKLYFKLAISKKPATAFEVLWLNGDYLEKVKDRESEFGEVIQLNKFVGCKLIGSFQAYFRENMR